MKQQPLHPDTIKQIHQALRDEIPLSRIAEQLDMDHQALATMLGEPFWRPEPAATDDDCDK